MSSRRITIEITVADAETYKTLERGELVVSEALFDATLVARAIAGMADGLLADSITAGEVAAQADTIVRASLIERSRIREGIEALANNPNGQTDALDRLEVFRVIDDASTDAAPGELVEAYGR